MHKYGPKDVRAIASYVGSRNATQVRTHAQKYFLRVAREAKAGNALQAVRKRSMSESDLARVGRAVGTPPDSPLPRDRDGEGVELHSGHMHEHVGGVGPDGEVKSEREMAKRLKPENEEMDDLYNEHRGESGGIASSNMSQEDVLMTECVNVSQFQQQDD